MTNFDDYIAEHRKNPEYARLEEEYRARNPIITIYFEKLDGAEFTWSIQFSRCEETIACAVFSDPSITVIGRGFANCHPSDTFSWEFGMRLSMMRACHDHMSDIYRAFRRWMWLAKIGHKFEYWVFQGDSRMSKVSDVIAREFGNVKVSIL